MLSKWKRKPNWNRNKRKFCEEQVIVRSWRETARMGESMKFQGGGKFKMKSAKKKKRRALKFTSLQSDVHLRRQAEAEFCIRQSAMNTTHDPWPPRLRKDGTDSYSGVWALLRCDTFSERYPCLSIDYRGNTADVIPNWEPIIKCSKFGKMNPDWEYMGLMVLYLYLSRQPLLVLIVGTLWKPLEGFWGALLLHSPFHQSL